jgi:hypothetical protein
VDDLRDRIHRGIHALKHAAGVHFREISYTDSEKDAHIAFVRTMLRPIFSGLTMLD